MRMAEDLKTARNGPSSLLVVLEHRALLAASAATATAKKI